jgi:hypothetical protein
MFGVRDFCHEGRSFWHVRHFGVSGAVKELTSHPVRQCVTKCVTFVACLTLDRKATTNSPVRFGRTAPHQVLALPFALALPAAFGPDASVAPRAFSRNAST